MVIMQPRFSKRVSSNQKERDGSARAKEILAQDSVSDPLLSRSKSRSNSDRGVSPRPFNIEVPHDEPQIESDPFSPVNLRGDYHPHVNV